METKDKCTLANKDNHSFQKNGSLKISFKECKKMVKHIKQNKLNIQR